MPVGNDRTVPVNIFNYNFIVGNNSHTFENFLKANFKSISSIVNNVYFSLVQYVDFLLALRLGEELIDGIDLFDQLPGYFVLELASPIPYHEHTSLNDPHAVDNLNFYIIHSLRYRRSSENLLNN